MQKASEKLLDECDKTIINEFGNRTLGDILCKNIMDNQWISTRPEVIRDIKIGFGFSVCRSKWLRINGNNDFDDIRPFNKDDLTLPEELCCRREGPPTSNTYKFFRCDGSSYKRSCDEN